MCISPDRYVEARVYSRLVERGVPKQKAAAVARKVRRGYEERRRERLAASSEAKSTRSGVSG